MTEPTIYTAHVDAGRETHTVLATHDRQEAIDAAQLAFTDNGCEATLDYGAFTETAWVEEWRSGESDSHVVWNAKGEQS